MRREKRHVISQSKFVLFNLFQSGNTMSWFGSLASDHQTPTVVLKLFFSDRYWKESHFHAIDRVLKALDSVYGSQKPTLTSAAMRWMYHHSKLQVFAVKNINYIDINTFIRPILTKRTFLLNCVFPVT